MRSGSVRCSFNPQPLWIDFDARVNRVPGLQIWYASASALRSLEAVLQPLLSPVECEAASRFYRPGDRLRYTVQHGLLKLLLRWYIGNPEFEPTFGYNPNKKPYLLNHPQIHFNLSNTGDEFLIAITDAPIGVDIEPVKPDFAYQDIAAHYFNNAEIAFINRSPNPVEAFFLLWTRKEALLKASGKGIDDDLPLIPALDGVHQLPPHFEALAWLTESFLLDRSMISVTQVSPGLQVHNRLLSVEAVNRLLSVS